MTSYEIIFDRFLQKIEDPELALLEENDQIEAMIGWLNSALANMELEGITLTSDLTKKDDEAMEFEDDLSNIELEIISIYMECSWYDPKINGIETYLMFVGTNNEKWSDQKNRLSSLREHRDAELLRARKLYRDYGYKHNSYFGSGDNNEV